MRRIDLHIHTTASDGTMTPSEAVYHARALGLSAIAVTDHDTASGVPEALAAGRKEGVEVIPGIEVSVDYEGFGIHILGYFIDPAAPSLRELLDWVVAERERRNGLIAAAMAADGLDVSLEKLRERYPGAVLGRPHFAQALVDAGLAADVNDAFARYLSSGGPYYRRREYIPLPRAFEVIARSGGKAVFAHPLQYRMSEEQLLALAGVLKAHGAVGMECLYSGYTRSQVERLKLIASALGLCVTGGSDFHGSRKPHIRMGSEHGIPYELLEKLKKA